MTRRSSRSGQPGNRGLQGPPKPEIEVPPFVSVDREPSPLMQRARAYLQSGPSDSISLIEHVCRLPGAPRAVAEQLASALFLESPDVRREVDGRWSLVREVAVPRSLTHESV